MSSEVSRMIVPQPCISSAPRGDCWRACLATITGFDAASMPNFMHIGGSNADDGIVFARRWLDERGLAVFSHWVDGDLSLAGVLQDVSKFNPGVAVILSGRTIADDDYHSVVVMNGRIVHDPSGAGIGGPCQCACEAPDCKRTHWALVVICRFQETPDE